MMFPNPLLMARIGEAFSDLKNDGLIQQAQNSAQQWEQYARSLERILAQQKDEYRLLMEYALELKTLYMSALHHVRGEYGIELLPVPLGFATALGLRVSYVRFFESGYDVPSYEHRKYSTTFKRSNTRYVNCEYGLRHLPPGRNMDYEVTMFWNKLHQEDWGTQTTKVSAHIDPEWDNSYYSSGIGSNEAGNWIEGTYLVIIAIAEELVAQATFEIC